MRGDLANSSWRCSWLRPAPSAYSGRVGRRFAALDSIRKAAAMARELEMPASTFDELRDLAIAALTRPDIRLVKEWEGWPEGNRGLVFDATFKHYARVDTQGNVTVRRVADDAEIAHRPGKGATVTPEGFDEDGRGLILVDSGRKARKRWRFDRARPCRWAGSLLPSLWKTAG